mgnify:CR=1 FL=1
MQVSIIIVNYNTKDITENCIASIISQTKDVQYEIILVDNASADGSKEYFENRNGILYIYSSENLGFGRANNLGAEKAKGELLFLLNSDTILIENSIKKMCDFFYENENKLNIGVLGCKLIDEKHQIMHSGGYFPTPFSEYLLMFSSYFKFKSKEFIIDETKEYQMIEKVTGADMLLRKTVFDLVLGFSPLFFMYFEETDMQKRISKLKYKNYIYNNTSIIHLEGFSFNKLIANSKRVIVQRSKNLYFKRNFNYYIFYVFVDMLFNLIRLFNLKYTMQENIVFIKENIRSYFSNKRAINSKY